jgi:hypothetical protein
MICALEMLQAEAGEDQTVNRPRRKRLRIASRRQLSGVTALPGSAAISTARIAPEIVLIEESFATDEWATAAPSAPGRSPHALARATIGLTQYSKKLARPATVDRPSDRPIA